MRRLLLLALAFACLSATYRATPATWATMTAQATTPGDVVEMAPGRYPMTWFGLVGITYRSVPPLAASIAGIGVGGNAGELTFDGLDVSGSTHDGVQVDSGPGHRFINLHVHDNAYAGYQDKSGAQEATVSSSEFDHNGLASRSPGIALGGVSTRVASNHVHGNGDYGILCWGCTGTAEFPVLIENNVVDHNAKTLSLSHGGSEIGVGGYIADGGLVHDVIVRNNVASGAPTFYGIYILCSCADKTQGGPVEVYGNRLLDNRSGPLAVARCDRMLGLSIHDNSPATISRQTCAGSWYSPLPGKKKHH